MLTAVRSSHRGFRPVRFSDGFNIVVAEQSPGSTEKDSTNGVGKTALLEIINFCLGGNVEKEHVLSEAALAGWDFTLDLTLGGRPYSATRALNDASFVVLQGDFGGWPIQPTLDKEAGHHFLETKRWTKLLGSLVFDLPVTSKSVSWGPSFRSLISYYTRFRRDAYLDPTKHMEHQALVDVQVNTAFLLGLNWEYPIEFHKLKDTEKKLEGTKKLAEQGILPELGGSPGKLTADRFSRLRELESLRSQLKTFRVHPEYEQLQSSADRLTKEIHDSVEDATVFSRLIQTYGTNLEEEKDVDPSQLLRVYEEAGVVFPELLKKSLSELQKFHKGLIANRREFLEVEISRLEDALGDARGRIQVLSDDRSKVLEILSSHGALEEFSLLQSRATALENEVAELSTKIDQLTAFEKGKTKLDAEAKELLRRTTLDLRERMKAVLQDPIQFFAANTAALYDVPGSLSIDPKEGGYRIEVSMEREKSQGFGHMKIFCYDLMLAQVRAPLGDKPGFLFHDSFIFAGVDPRQRARALKLALKDSRQRGYQYICTMNLDSLDGLDLDKETRREIDERTRLRLGDSDPSLRLFGFKFG